MGAPNQFQGRSGQLPAVAQHQFTHVRRSGNSRTGHQRGLGCTACRDHDLRESGGYGRMDGGQDAAHGVERAVEPELTNMDREKSEMNWIFI